MWRKSNDKEIICLISDSVTIGDNVKVRACVLITDTDAHPLDYLARRTSNDGTKSAPIVIEECLGRCSFYHSQGSHNWGQKHHWSWKCGYKEHSC